MAKVISVPNDVGEKLDDLKRSEQESYGSVISYLVNFYKNNKDRDGVKL